LCLSGNNLRGGDGSGSWLSMESGIKNYEIVRLESIDDPTSGLIIQPSVANGAPIPFRLYVGANINAVPAGLATIAFDADEVCFVDSSCYEKLPADLTRYVAFEIKPGVKEAFL
jgi:hypothetical protein